MTRRTTILVNLAMGLIAVTLTLGVVEVALRFLYPQSDRHYVLLPNQTETLTPLEEHVHGVRGSAVYRTSSAGIRGPELGDDDEFRILAIGGSTTQNAYLDQSETWTLLVGQLLGPTSSGRPTWAGDVGRSGHTARSHVLQFQYLVPELPRIDVVLMLVGVNDLTAALRKGFAYEPDPPLSDPEARAVQMRQAFLRVPGRLHNRSTNYLGEGVGPLKRTALYQLARAGRDAIRERRGGTSQDRFGEIYVTWRGNRAAASEIYDSLPDLTPALRQYRGYLEDIASMAVDDGVRLVLITQPTAWREDMTDAERARLWLGGTGDFQTEPGHAYFSTGALRRGMDAYNATLLSVCEEFGVECVDAAAGVPQDTLYFYDDVHFTEEGSRLVAELIADHLRARPPYSGTGAH